MNDRYFIEDSDLVNMFLKKLTPLNKHSEWDCELLIDKDTGQKWEKYLFEDFDSEEDPVGLRKYPYPDTSEIIRIALTSSYPDEVAGASALLVDLEYDKIEFREKLISEIEHKINGISKGRYELIYNRAELYDVTNRREILGKHHTEIEEDAKHYHLMMERAENIKRITAANIGIATTFFSLLIFIFL